MLDLGTIDDLVLLHCPVVHFWSVEEESCHVLVLAMRFALEMSLCFAPLGMHLNLFCSSTLALYAVRRFLSNSRPFVPSFNYHPSSIVTEKPHEFNILAELP